MKNIVFFRLALLFFGIILISRKASTQDFHFAYIQSENKQPFYVLFENRNIPSSSSGYVILSRLEDGSYPLRVGFKGTPLQDYMLVINAGDLGFIIRDFGDKGWGLVNMQNAAVQVSGEESAKIQSAIAAQKEQEEKRVADSVDAAIAAQRVSDSLQAEALITQHLMAKAAQEKKLTDSINKKIATRETKWKEDSAKAALKMQRAAEKAAEQAKQKETAAAKTTTAKNAQINTTAAIEPVTEVSSKIAEGAATAAVVVPVAAAVNNKSSKTGKPTAKASEKEKAVAEKEQPFESIEPKTTPATEPGAAEVAPKTIEEPTAAIVVAPVAVNKASSKTVKNTDTKPKSSSPVRLSQSVSDAGLVMLYKDGSDTINAFISYSKAPVKIDSVAIDTKQATDTVVKVSAASENQKTVPKRAVDVAGKKGKGVKPQAVPKAADISVSSDPVKAETVLKPDTAATVASLVESQNTAPKRAVDVAGKKGNPAKPKVIPMSSAVVIASDPVETEQPVIKQDTVAASVAKPVETKEVETAAVIPVMEPAENTTKNKKTSGSITSNNSNTKIVTVTPAPVAADSSVTTAVEANAACKALAADKDFYSLRKKMIANDNPDNMISTAKKAFKEKCYSTTQVRNLCVLFLSDPERYMFLDAVYPYTSDNLNFGKLSDLLQDDYYVRRFKAMLK